MAQFCSHCLTPEARAETDDLDTGMFGRLFRDLPPLKLDPEVDLKLGCPGGPMDAAAHEQAPHLSDNPDVPAGWTFFGQIVAHDMTHTRAPLHLDQPPSALRNYRTPRLDLEVVYGAGPIGQPFLYQRADADKLLLGRNDLGQPDDLPRNPEGLAIIGDSRDDTYLFISQLHLALMKLHNRLVDDVRAAGTTELDVFGEAQRLTRWHYQWLVLHEYLPLTIGPELVQELLHNELRVFKPNGRAFVPVEFSAAAFRFGHSQICSTYEVNDKVRGVPIFPDLVGQRPVPASLRPDWWRFFNIPNSPDPQPSKRVDVVYAGALERLPHELTGELGVPDEAALAYRDLLRGASMALPSGEDVARAMGEVSLARDELGLPPGVCTSGTPLCYYVLREAEVETGGTRLGPVGGRLVGEVIVGLLRADPTSYLHVDPDWKPSLSLRNDGDFTMADLLIITGAVPQVGRRAA